MKIKIEIHGKQHELTPEEARQLYYNLARVFEVKQTPDYPVFSPQCGMPYVPPGPQLPQWHEPYYDPVCGL